MRTVLLALLVAGLVAASTLAQAPSPARSPAHQALEDILAQLDAPETHLEARQLEELTDRTLEQLSIMATSEARWKGTPERFVGARLALQIGNVLLHRHHRTEDARLLAARAQSVYASQGGQEGALMTRALEQTEKGFDGLGRAAPLGVGDEPPDPFWRRVQLALLVLGGLLGLGVVVYLARGHMEAPEGVTVVDARAQQQAMTSLKLGMRLLEQGRTDEAVKYFRAVAEIESGLRQSGRYHLALVSVQRGEVEEATTLIQDLDLSEVQLEEVYTLGDALERRGQAAAARQVFEKLYLADVAFRDVKQRLDRLRSETSEYSEEDVAGVIASRVIEKRFQGVSLVQSGGMGFVFQATDSEQDGRRVALKVLSPFYANDSDAHGRFLREARGMAGLRHPHIIRIHDVFPKSLPYYSMDFHDEPTLKQVLVDEGRLGPARVARLGRQLADALQAVHQVGVVHRDLKPANLILANREGADHLILLDFGIAQFSQGTRMTLTGQVLGSPRYMSPEQQLGDEVDARSDLYSLGVVLYELACGTLPGPDELAATRGRFPPLPPGLGLSPELEAAIMGALAQDPNDRPSLDELRGSFGAA